ncbi:MAG: hypothetical protein NTV34_12725, partial [Proteobacteria bacterium]|nr:hypothetical protein [Pseudomonadota bacterium]
QLPFRKGARPVVHYSDVWAGENNATLTGLFDVTYFNAVVPFGSKITIHYGFEVSTYDPYLRRYVPTSHWNDASSMSLKQWEEYGWVTRLTRIIMKKGSWTATTGLDFYLEIQTPSGEVFCNRGGPDDRNYYRAGIPNMAICADLGHEYLKICAVTLEVALKP